MWNEPSEQVELEALLGQDQSDLERLETVISLAYLARRDFDRCEQWLAEADQLVSTMTGEPAGHVADILYIRQYAQGEAGDRTGAILVCQKALLAYEELGDIRGEVSALLSLTHYHTLMRHHTSARSYTQRLRELTEADLLPPGLEAAVLYEMANAYFTLGLLEFAKKYGSAAAEHEGGRFGGLLMVTLAEIEAGDFEDALDHAKQALEAAAGTQSWELAAIDAEASALAGLGRHAEVLERLQGYLEEYQGAEDTGYSSSSHELGKAFRALGHYDEAETWMLNALRVATESDSRREAATIVRTLSDLYYDAGDYQAAADNLRRYVEINDQEIEYQQRSEIAALAAQHEFELTNKELELSKVEAQALTHRNELLQQANEEQQEILHVVAHDLATPLTSIGLAAEVIGGAGDNSGDRVPTMASRIQGAVDYMAGVVAQLTLLGRVDADDIAVELAPVDLHAEVKVVLDALAAKFDVDDIKVNVSGLGDHSVLSDRLQLERILQNLVSNAAKFSPPGSTVTITSRIVEAGVDSAGDTSVHGAGRPVKMVEMAVTDTGVGIAPEDLAKLFSKFGRLENHPDHVATTTGLGLYISQRLAHLMHGEILVHSPGPGLGSTFTLRLRSA